MMAIFVETILHWQAEGAAPLTDKMEDRYLDGIFVSMRAHTDEMVVATARGKGTVDNEAKRG